MSSLLIFGLIAGVIYTSFVILYSLIVRARELKNAIEYKKLQQSEIEIRNRELFHKYKQEADNSIKKILEEKTIGFPWLATAISDYKENYDLIFAKYLTIKKRPAFKKAEEIKRIAAEKKLFKKEYLTSKYIINYYESLFPWLKDYVGFDSAELLSSINEELNSKNEADPVSFYITKSEYESLPSAARNQKALDRYWNRNKSLWEIGRDYERYIGFRYEERGFKVHYHGIFAGKGDMGRDLICHKGNLTHVVQCKYWSEQKGILIRENHIMQLYGTTIKYYLDSATTNTNPQISIFPELIKSQNIKPVLVYTNELSETAKEFADTLNILTLRMAMKNDYPCIKCNINPQTGEKIYHLPFDQQYDKTKIDVNTGECWVRTVKEAENLGFRRAWRWNKNA